jgi:hypothetical protein
MHSRLIPEGVAETSQTILRDAHALQKIFSYEEKGRINKNKYSKHLHSRLSSP